jgi:hypothetical protein
MGAPWHAQIKAVPCQPNVQTGFLRAAVPLLLSCTSQFCSPSRLPDILDFELMLALCAYAHRAIDEAMLLNDC